MDPDICIYHGPGCIDGLVAAWAIWSRWPKAQFIPAQYGQTPPDVDGKHVLIVDFSYKRSVLEDMAKTARTITVLDHHKTAQADLVEFTSAAYSSVDGILRPLNELSGAAALLGRIPIQARFDLTKSGARLAWEYAFPGAQAPILVQAVEDRDLWRFDLPGTKPIHALLTSYPEVFETVEDIYQTIQRPGGFIDVIAQGEGILRAYDKALQSMLAATQRRMTIAGHDVPVANLPPIYASDAGNIMSVGEPFAATYYDTKSGRRSFSLRSAQDGLDVSEIAAKYGGGGHKHAAGFSVETFKWSV